DPVVVIEQVEGVRDPDDPDHGDRAADDVARDALRKQRKAPHADDEADRDERLDEELDLRAELVPVVDEAEEEDHEPAAGPEEAFAGPLEDARGMQRQLRRMK